MSSRKSAPSTYQPELEYLTGILGEIKRLVRVVEEYVSTSEKRPALVEFNNGKGHNLGMSKEKVVGGKRTRAPHWKTLEPCPRVVKSTLAFVSG